MTRTLGIIIFIVTTLTCFGQKTFRRVTGVDPTETFISEFIIGSDSSCYYNKYYKDNSVFFLYKGKISKLNDTLYKFTYIPIVEFACNKRLYWKTDSVYITVETKDTVIGSLIFDVKTSKFQAKVDCSKQNLNVIKNAGTENFTIDTKFRSPLSNEKIIMTIIPMSEPVLLFYGQNTPSETVTISIKKQTLKVHYGQGKIWQDDTLRLAK